MQFNRLNNETEEDYTYRMLGSAGDWVFDVQSKEELPEGIPRNIWYMYCEIKDMSSYVLEDELFQNRYSGIYKEHSIAGAWCRTWCRIAQDEMDSRDDETEEEQLATLNAGP